MKKFTPLLFLLLLLAGCAEPPEYAIEPKIAFLGFNQTEIHQGIVGNPIDTLEISFSFEDGDGDIGSQETVDVYLTDSRTAFQEQFLLPVFENDVSEQGISGTITLKLPNNIYLCCIYPDLQSSCIRNAELPRDSYFYTIQIKDRAGNWSNTVETDLITLICD